MMTKIAVAALIVFVLLFYWMEKTGVFLTPSTPIHITVDFSYGGKPYHQDFLTQTETTVGGDGSVWHGEALHRVEVPLDDGSGLLIFLDKGPMVDSEKLTVTTLPAWVWINNFKSPTQMIFNWVSEPQPDKPELINPNNIIFEHIRAFAGSEDSGKTEAHTSPLLGLFAYPEHSTSGLLFGGLNAALVRGDAGNGLRKLAGWQKQPDGCSILFATGENLKPIFKFSHQFPLEYYGVYDQNGAWHIEQSHYKTGESDYTYALGQETLAPETFFKARWQQTTTYVNTITHDGVTCHLPHGWLADIAVNSLDDKWIITLTPSAMWAMIPASGLNAKP